MSRVNQMCYFHGRKGPSFLLSSGPSLFHWFKGEMSSPFELRSGRRSRQIPKPLSGHLLLPPLLRAFLFFFLLVCVFSVIARSGCAPQILSLPYEGVDGSGDYRGLSPPPPGRQHTFQATTLLSRVSTSATSTLALMPELPTTAKPFLRRR